MKTHALFAAILLLGGPSESTRGDSLADIESIGVYSTTGRGSTASPDVSAFLGGYLSNIKNYTAHNLDLYYVTSHEEARQRASKLGAAAVLAVHVEGFTEYENTARGELKLFDTESGEAIREWSATLAAPYFDPPQYRHIQPYGNLDQVFSELPLRSYEAPVEIRLLVVSDQRLRGSSGSSIRDYLLSQLATASRILEREFGIALTVTHLKRWSPPDVGIVGVARAAAGIEGREGADLTLVCLGPPAPVTYWDGVRVLGYARVLTNIVVTRVMNAHVFVHEIGHVLGAIHTDDEGVIMEPMMRTYAIDGRFRVLPPMMFSSLNRRIIDITRAMPLGAGFEQHSDKMAQLVVAYEGLREDRLKEIAPYYGGLLVDLGKTEQAIEVFRSALAKAPNDGIVRGMLVDALRRSGRYGEAQQMVQGDFDIDQARLNGMTGGAVGLAEFAAISLSASFLSFGEVGVDGERAMKITIANLGTATLELSRIHPPSRPFSLAASVPRDALIEPGKSLAIEALFRPVRAGRFQSTLEIVSNARGAETAEVRLSGQGVE